jgi:hypothetical protein
MTTDYIVASLPALAFGEPAPMEWGAFEALAGGRIAAKMREWADIETQLRNAAAEARGGANRRRKAEGCSLYWRNRVKECFAEKDVAARDEMIDRVWWDAAGELADVADPLGAGALAAYAVRLKIAARRSAISKEAGDAAFDRLASAGR